MPVLTAQAAIVEAPRAPFRIAPVEIDPPGRGQVRVEIHACGVCHTDMVMRDGELPVPFPVVSDMRVRASSRPSAPASRT